jgi:hypothetical protein
MRTLEDFREETRRMSEHIGQVFGEQKQIPRRCANRIRQFFNVQFAVCSGRMDIARIAKT